MLSSEYIETATEEDKILRSVIMDKNCEELAFPHSLGKGSLDIQLNVKQNYHQSNILIKDYLITCRG